MFVYDDLDQDVRKFIKYRLLYLTFLTLVNFYCVNLIYLNLYTWLSKLILICNVISTITSLIHIWMMIHNNKIDPDAVGVIAFVETIITPILIISMIIYSFDNKSNIEDNVYYEFIIIKTYLLVVLVLIVPYFIMFIDYICNLMLSTIKIVNERNIKKNK